MRSIVVIKLAPFLDHDLRFSACHEPFPVQAFVAQLAVKAFHEPVLLWAAGFDIGGSDILVPQPLHRRCGGEFGAVIRPDESRLSIQPHQPRQRQDHILVAQRFANLDGQTFSRMLFQYAQHLQCAAIGQPVMHESYD